MRAIQDNILAATADFANLAAGRERLIMPPYQRSYSWGEQEALDLLSDLREANASGSFHFIGAIVLIQSETNKHALEIVDGQQRLTTLTMVLCALRDFETDEDMAEGIHKLISFDERRETLWRLNLNQTDGPFFRSHVQLENKLGARPSADEISDSQKRILSNYDAITTALHSASLAERRSLLETIKHKCQLVRVMVNSREDGYKVFRVLNSRGREPNAHDIIKTDLLEQARLPREKANLIAEKWTEYEAQLGDVAFDSLLRQIRMLYDQSARGSFVSGFRKSVLSDTSAANFLEDRLPRFVQAYDVLHRAEVDYGAESVAISQSIHRLSMLEHQGWQAPALKFLFQNETTPENAKAFFSALERIAYVIQLIIHDRDQRTKRYRRILEAVDANANFKNAKIDSLAVSKDELKRLNQRLQGRFATFRQRRAIAFLLNNNLPNGQHLTPEADATVEHVLPRNPSQDSVWQQVWPDARVRRDLCDTLGNFTLLTHRTNQRADRKEFQDKKEIIFDGNSDSAHFQLTQDIADVEVWTPDIVRARTARLSDVLLTYWGL